MSLSGLEPVKEEILTPAVDVAAGRSTVDQVHREYQGMELICPHCLQEWLARLGNEDISDMLMRRKHLYTKEQLQGLREMIHDNGLLATMKAGIHMFPDDLRVRFRRGSLDKSNTVARWMHWFHTIRRDDRSSKLPCHDPGCVDHAVAVGAIQLTLEDRYKLRSDMEIVREKDLIITLGEPPLKRRPDLIVRKGDQVVEILEIQRSVLSKDDFIERTQHLLSICSDVQWIFFRGTYNRMGPQRQWLSNMGLSYYYLFLEGYKLVIADGCPPVPKVHKVANKSTKSDCRFNDPKERSDIHKEPSSEPSLPLSVVGAALFRKSNHTSCQNAKQLPGWNCSVGDKVEVRNCSKWLLGSVFSYTESGVPVVRLQKSNQRLRYISPSSPEHLRLFQPSRPEAKLPQDSKQLQQLSLFS